MGRIKNWLMDMEEDAQQMSLEKFIRRHGKQNANIWSQVNEPSEKNYSAFPNTPEDLQKSNLTIEKFENIAQKSENIPF